MVREDRLLVCGMGHRLCVSSISCQSISCSLPESERKVNNQSMDLMWGEGTR